jgi:hypothetical protein
VWPFLKELAGFGSQLTQEAQNLAGQQILYPPRHVAPNNLQQRPTRTQSFSIQPPSGPPSGLQTVAGSFKRPPDEAVTKEVTKGQWPKPSADKKKCVTSSTDLDQFNFFESTKVNALVAFIVGRICVPVLACAHVCAA